MLICDRVNQYIKVFEWTEMFPIDIKVFHVFKKNACMPASANDVILFHILTFNTRFFLLFMYL